jgi:hypothetical protein
VQKLSLASLLPAILLITMSLVTQIDKYVQKKRESLSLVDIRQSIDSRIPFWFWDDLDHYNNKISGHSDCCFNHIVGVPTRLEDDGRRISMPLLLYQKTIYQALQTHRRIAILKSRGLGVSEFFLRWIAYCCLSGRFGNNYRNNNDAGRVCIATGPRLETATDLMSRLKNLLAYKETTAPIFEKSHSTEVKINGVTITAFPSYNSSSMRGFTNVKFIMCDEFSWWPDFQATEIMGVLVGYQVKAYSNPYIILISTPNKPDDAMQKELENNNSMFHKLYFDYNYGLEGPFPIYSKKQIEIARKSREFPREFELQPICESGSIFSQHSIDRATRMPYNPDMTLPVKVPIGVDPSYGSSNFAITATRLVSGTIQVIEPQEYERPDFNDMIDKVASLNRRLGITALYCDAANPEIIRELKRVVFKEEYREDKVSDLMKMAETYGYSPTRYMRCVGISFSKHGSQMLQHAKALMDEGLIAIDKQRFHKLLIGLRTATADEYKLDKSKTSYDDIVDSFRLSLMFFNRGKH